MGRGCAFARGGSSAPGPRSGGRLPHELEERTQVHGELALDGHAPLGVLVLTHLPFAQAVLDTQGAGKDLAGLVGATGLVLQVNGAGDLLIAADGTFTFATRFDNSSTYEVTVLTEPTATPARDCAVNDGIGRIAGASVNNVRVICSPIIDLYAANAEVSAIALSDDGSTLYLGGEFTKVGPPTGTFVAIDAGSGQVTSSPGGLFGPQTRVAAPDGNGGWYVGGYYDSFGRGPDSLLHVLPDGSVDPNWNPEPDGTVTEIAVSGSTVYVAGAFSNIGGQSRRYLAALDAATGQATDWDPDPSVQVRALLVSGNTLYVGGVGGVVSGQTRVQRRGIAAFDIASVQLTAWDPNVIGPVESIAVSGNTVYVGGTISSVGGFLSEGGVSRSGLAALDAVTGAPTSWAPVVDAFTPYSGGDATVREIILDGNTAYIAGDFVQVEGETRNALAALDLTTGALTSWNPDVTGPVESMAQSGGSVYVTGSFDAIGGQPRDYLGAVDVATGQVTAWNPDGNDRGYFVTALGGSVYVGGEFSSVGGMPRERLAAIDTATGALTPWDPGADDRVETIEVVGNAVYVGGEFTTVGGQPRSRLASIDAATGLVNPWAPEADAEVLSIAADSNTVYIGGRFRNVGGQARNRLAAIDATSGLVTAWDPDASFPVFTVALAGTTVYVGGEFSNVGGQNRVAVAAVDSMTGEVTSWDPGLMTFVYDIEVVGNTVYLGTELTNIGNAFRGIIAVDASTGMVKDLGGGPASFVNSISVRGNTLYFGGFLTLGGMNILTGAKTPFDMRLNSGVEAIIATESVVYAAGVFDRVPGRPGSRIAAFPR